jgi:hypothetical protein
MSMRELRKREMKRNHGAYLNSVRFNWSWLIRNMYQKTTCAGSEDECWSLAMAFQRVADGSGTKTVDMMT